MPFQPVAATARAEVVMSLDGQLVENNIYVRQDFDYSPADLSDLGAEIIDWWTNEMSPLLSSSVQLLRVVCTALHDQTGPQAIRVPLTPTSGQLGGNTVPNNCALCVSFRTDLIGRAFRGRNYVCGLEEGQVDKSIVLPAVAESIRLAYATLNTYLGESRRHVVVTRVVNGVVQAPTALTNPVTAYVLVDNIIDSQRRRLPGRGQ